MNIDDGKCKPGNVQHGLQDLSAQFAGTFGNYIVAVHEYRLHAQRIAESGISIEFLLKITAVLKSCMTHGRLMGYERDRRPIDKIMAEFE
jgi:hypothetical protein